MQNNLYWVVSISENDGHVMETARDPTNAHNPVRTWRVLYHSLRYRFIDLEEEARIITQKRKSEIDPRKLADPRNTIDDILALPQMKGREKEREYLAKVLEFIRKVPADILRRKTAEYDQGQELSTEELYEKVKRDLEQRRNYVPEEITPFTPYELSTKLPEAGYTIIMKDFEEFDGALRYLHHRWEAERLTEIRTTSLS